MATRPVTFELVDPAVCSSCGREKYVLRSNVKSFPDVCVVCLYRMIDAPMEWRLSNAAIQTLAHREHAATIHAEQDAMESSLPVELRQRKKA